MTDDWLKQIDLKLLVGTVLLDFSEVTDIINHELLLIKLAVYGFKPLAITGWKATYVLVICIKIMDDSQLDNIL